MASILSHPAIPLALAAAAGPRLASRRLVIAAAAASMLPDIDALGYWAGIPYGSTFGHRGFTHSIVFALLIALVGLGAARLLEVSRVAAFAGLFLSTVSHGVLDAMTTGGLGVAFLSPFSNQRFFFPWRVIQVSPIGVLSFFSEWGARVLASELIFVWLPSLTVAALALLLRRAAVHVTSAGQRDHD